MAEVKQKYSLWLRPTQTQIDEFNKIISELSHRFHTTPFPPHITLLSGLVYELGSLNHLCEEIYDEMHSFDIPMQGIAFSPEYYRNFFIKAEPTSTLLALYNKAKLKLKCAENEEYMPHVSLLYGELDIKTKLQLIKDLEDHYTKIFSCKRLDIYNCSGDIVDWFMVKSYELPRHPKIYYYK